MKAIFLDRDGVINIEKHYLYEIQKFQLIDGVITGLKNLKKNGFLLFVITNQSGIARGYYKEDDVNKLHTYINSLLIKEDAGIDKFYYCPHHPTKGIGAYKQECTCRKPKTGMIEKAINEYNVNVNESYLIGDRISDIDCGKALGIKSYLVRTGYGMKTEKYIKENDEYLDVEIYDNVLKVSENILVYNEI